MNNLFTFVYEHVVYDFAGNQFWITLLTSSNAYSAVPKGQRCV